MSTPIKPPDAKQIILLLAVIFGILFIVAEIIEWIHRANLINQVNGL